MYTHFLQLFILFINKMGIMYTFNGAMCQRALFIFIIYGAPFPAVTRSAMVHYYLK